jgi:hypothetical protein
MLDWLGRKWDALLSWKWAPGLAALALFVALVAYYGGRYDDRDLWVETYCAYGSQSEDQFYGCVDHVTVEDVERSSSDAALCARDAPDECDGAGPYWQPWLDGRALDELMREPPDGRGPYGAVPAARSS